MPAKFTIVVADDNPDVVETLARQLEHLGSKYKINLNIIQKISAYDVLAQVENSAIDAFYLDYHFEQGMSGDEIIQNLHDPFGNKFILLMSSKDKESLDGIITKNYIRLKSKFRFLRKPYDELMLQDVFLDMLEFLEKRSYPFPLQYTYDACHTTQEGMPQFVAIKDFFEILIKYQVAILMSNLMENEKDFPRFRAKIDIRTNLTFGAWLTWLMDLSEYFQKQSCEIIIPEIIPFLNAYHDVLFEFKDVRNAEIGHGFAKDQEWYMAQVIKYLPIIEKIHKELLFLAPNILMFQEKSEFTGDNNGIKYQIRKLMGSDIKPTRVEAVFRQTLIQKEVYIFTPNNRFLSLNPFVTYKYCDKCETPKVYVLDQIQSNHFSYNSFCNHRIKDEKIFKQYKSVFERMVMD